MCCFKMNVHTTFLFYSVLCCIKCVNSRLFTTTDDNTVIIYGGELRVEINKKPWQLKIYDNNTEELIVSQEDGRYQQLGYGKWEGKYIDPYQGYLFRIGAMVYEYQATNVVSVIHGTEDVTLVVGTNDPRKTNILARIYSFKDRQLSLSFMVDPPLDSNRFFWGFKSLEDDEGFYGFGERFNNVNQRGEKLGCWLEDGSFGWGKFDPHIRFPGGKTSTYVPMPLFISSRKYGFQLDTFYRSEFDSKTLPGVMHIVTESSSFNATIFAGKTVKETIKMMTDINGRSLIPPKWAFGPWNQLGTEIKGETETERAKQLLFNQDIPVSVVIDTVHFFPDGEADNKHQQELENNQQLLELGLPSTAYYNPMVTTTFNATYIYGDKMGYFTKNKDGQSYQYDYVAAKLFHVSQVDYTNQQASQWYEQHFQQALNVLYRGWMYDYGEYTPYDSVNSLGQSGLRSHNEYPLLYQKACFDFLTKNQSETSIYAPDYLFYVRSGYLGSQRYTWAHWTGDPSSDWTEASGLPAQVVASLSIGISGMPFSGSDIGGFEWYTGPSADEELWVRWTQYGCFSGFMHEQGGGKGLSRKTHIFDSKNGTMMWRKFAKLRTQLFPYIYTQAHTAHFEGIPIMRHHIIDFEDKKSFDYPHQYMFGEALLVAPVVRPGVTQWPVYLPDGESWIDVSSKLTYDEGDGRFRIAQNTIITGGILRNVSAMLDTIPIFVRAGSVIPVSDPSVQTLRHANHPNVTSIDKSQVFHFWAWLNITNGAYGQDWQTNYLKVVNSSVNGSSGFEVEVAVQSNYTKVVMQITINPPGIPIRAQYKNGNDFKMVDSWQMVAKSTLKDVIYFDDSRRVLWMAVPSGTSNIIVYFK